MQEGTREELVRDVAGLEAESADQSDGDEWEDADEVYSVEEQLKCLAIAKATLERLSSLNEAFVQEFTQSQR